MAASVKDLTKQCGFIFEGTVRRTGASTSPEFEATPATAVVVADKIMKGPDVLSRFAGQEITVVFGETHDVPAIGARRVFFTTGLHFGAGLVVRAAGQVHETRTEMEREVKDAMLEAHHDELLAQLRAARLVVSGRVVETSTTGLTERAGSEHDPEWWECIIQVETVEKGSTDGILRSKAKPAKGKADADRITAYFAHSQDIAWYRSPKFEAGDRGVFLLHEGEIRGRKTPGLSVLHALDFRPQSELEQIRNLIARIQ